jgi:hypothetical protein
MRPKWDFSGPRIFVCRRCGRPVPGYEDLFIDRIRWLERRQKENDERMYLH